MRFKFIPPVKEMNLASGVPSLASQILSKVESEGFLKNIEWDLDEGIPGPWAENREGVAQMVPGVLKLVREACESGSYDAIIALGGLEPGLYAAKEIGAQFGIPVVGATSSSVGFAYILGNKYTIIDVLDGMAINLRQNMMAYGMNEKCASVRSIEMHINDARANLQQAIDKFVRECIEAIEKDGADVIVCGCTVTLLMQPLAQQRLKELGYDIQVLHGYKCAIEMAKAFANMKVCQSKIAFPETTPREKSIPR